MERLRTEAFATLLARREGPCVSLYMPTHRAGRETQQDPIRFKNLLRQAEVELKGVAVREGSAADILAPAQALLAEPAFWDHSRDGLAVFLSPGFSEVLRLPARLPERVVVSGTFHLKPLLPLLSGDGTFYVLAISQNRVRLLQATRDHVEELEPERMPRSLKEALATEAPQRVLQVRTAGPATSGGRRVGLYHGHGGLGDVEKTNLLRYFRRVDEGLVEYLAGRPAPVVLAGVEHYFPLYREASRHPHLVPEGIAGNPDDLKPEELHRRAWAVMEPHFRSAQEAAKARFRAGAGTGRTSHDVEEVVRVAHHGRVETLFVARGMQRWGAYFPDAGGSAILHDRYEQGDQDLLDLAAAETLRNGGQVFAVMPEAMPIEGPPVAAILRY